MLKFLTVVSFGTVAISQMTNNHRYFPLVPRKEDWITVNKPDAFLGTKNIGKVPIMQHQSIPLQMNVRNAEQPAEYPYINPGPFVSPSQQQPPQCQNYEVLHKIWSIFLNLLVTDGEVKNPDTEKVKLALKLLKEYVEKALVQNSEVADKLSTIEEALLINKETRELKRRAFHTMDDNIDTNDTILTSSHRLPEKVNDRSCIEELAKVIQTAQKSYIQLTESPICKDSLASTDNNFRRSDLPRTVISPANVPISHNQYKRPSYDNIKNLNAKNNEALKTSLGLLMNQSDYNAHDVFELLQNFKPIQPTETVDTVEPVVNDSKSFNLNQTELSSNLLASGYNASQTSYNRSVSDNGAMYDFTSYSKVTKIDPLHPNEIELTYALKRPQPLVYQPYYFIKYRLPFNSFLQNLAKVTQMKSTDTSKSELYKSVIQSWNADEMSPDLAHYTREQVNELVLKEGNLVEALLIQSQDKNMRINLNTPQNLESQLSEFNFDKGSTKNGDGKHLIEAQAGPYYSADHNDASRRRQVESNIRPGLDTPPRFPGYPSMFQKGPPPTPLKSYSDHLLYKSGFGKTLPVPHLPSALIETVNRG